MSSKFNPQYNVKKKPKTDSEHIDERDSSDELQTESNANQANEFNWWQILVFAIVINFMLMGAYHYFIARNNVAKPIAVIDLNTISAALENEARTAMNTAVASGKEADAAAVAKQYEDRMKQLQGAVDKVAQTCECTLVIKAAILGNNKNEANHVVDYTPQVKQELKLN